MSPIVINFGYCSLAYGFCCEGLKYSFQQRRGKIASLEMTDIGMLKVTHKTRVKLIMLNVFLLMLIVLTVNFDFSFFR